MKPTTDRKNASIQSAHKAFPEKYIFEEEGPFYLDELRESRDKLNRAKTLLNKTRSVGEGSLPSHNRTKSESNGLQGLNLVEGSAL